MARISRVQQQQGKRKYCLASKHFTLFISWFRASALKKRPGQEANEGVTELGIREKLLFPVQMELGRQTRQHLEWVKAIENREIFLKVWTLDFLHLNDPAPVYRIEVSEVVPPWEYTSLINC